MAGGNSCRQPSDGRRMEMRTSGVLGVAVQLAPRRGLPAVPPDRTVKPRSTNDSSLMTAIADLRRSREGSDAPADAVRQMEESGRVFGCLPRKLWSSSIEAFRLEDIIHEGI